MARDINTIEVTEPPYDSQGAVTFKLHLDHIDNEDKRIWAVNINDGPYLIANVVNVSRVSLTAYPVGTTQPRAYLSGRGRVTQDCPFVIFISEP